MKFTYYFKPAQHWNVCTKEVYNVLCKFYDSDRIRAVEIKN